MFRCAFALLLLTAACCAAAAGHAETTMIDLTNAVIVVPPGLTGSEAKAVAMLVEEVRRRTRLTWQTVHAWPAGATPVIAVGPASALRTFVPNGAAALATDSSERKAEGYRLRVHANGAAPVVLV